MEILIICTIEFEPIKVDLMAAKLSDSQDESGKEKEVVEYISRLLSDICSPDRLRAQEHPFSLFVNHVNDIFDENLFIPLGRSLLQKGLTQIYFGNLNKYQIKSI
jgi:hypothetical protein